MKVLTEAQLRRFQQDGYLVVENVVDVERDIAPVIAEMNETLDTLAATLLAEGKITSDYRDLPFDRRLTEICAESGMLFTQHFDISLPQGNVKPNTPINARPSMFRLLSHPRLLDIAEDLIGPEIWSNPVQHIRTKLPARAISDKGNGLVGKIPWHQDNGVVMPEADETFILTCWMPLTRATVENGCMQVYPRSHNDGLAAHCPGGPGGLAIPVTLLPAREPTVLPMEPGSVLLMTPQTMHSSLDNVTDDEVRISLDLHYQPTGLPSGRPAFDDAGFVARSAAHPETALTEPEIWQRNWLEVRDRLAEAANPIFNRWDKNAPVCA